LRRRLFAAGHTLVDETVVTDIPQKQTTINHTGG
jgi:hypothetical protein